MNSSIVGDIKEGLLIDFGDTPLVDPTAVTAQPALYRPTELDFLLDDLEIPKLSSCPVTLPNSFAASSVTVTPDARKSSTMDLLTLIPSQGSPSSFTPSSFTPSANLPATKTTSSPIYYSRTRAERAAEPHTATKPNWARAPAIQSPIFTKEPRSMHLNGNPLPPKHILPPSQPPSVLNLVTNSTNDYSPAPLERPMAGPPHRATEAPLSKPPAPSIHPSRVLLLQSSGASNEAGFGPAETKEQTTKGSPNERITGANTVRVARMRKWGAEATEVATSTPGNADDKGATDSRVSWVNKDPSPRSSATCDAVPMGSKTVAPVRNSVQAATIPTPIKRQNYSVTVESEDEGDTYRPVSLQNSHIGNGSGQITNDSTKGIPIPAPSTSSVVHPSALKQRTVAEHSYEQTNPFMEPDSAQEPATIGKSRLPLLQRMGIGSRVGPSALAARRKLFIEEDGRKYDYAYQCADEDAYEGYEEGEHWAPPLRARAKKVVIVEPVGLEERVEHTPTVRTPAKRVVRIAEPGRVIHYQEGEQDEGSEYRLTYEQHPEEDLHIGHAASRRTPVSQVDNNPPPRVLAPMQHDTPHHVVGPKARRVVIQTPLEADNADGVVEKFRGLSIAGRVQTPGPRRHKIVKVQ